MAELEEIKSAVKEIALSISGIGKVYDRIVYASDQNQLKELFVSNGVLNCLMFRQVKRIADTESRESNEVLIDRLWKFVLLYSYSKENESERKFDDLCESICKTFNSNSSINDTVNEHSFMDMVNKTDYTYHNVLCHRAEFEMTTRG